VRNPVLTWLGYAWTLPNTLIGGLFVVAALLSGGRVRLAHGVVEVHGVLIAAFLKHAMPMAGGAIALTLGHVVLGRDARALVQSRAHERVHVAQYERWGLLFIPAYLLASVWVFLRGGHPYHDNPFERQACARASRTLGDPRRSGE
jgi:hypothetical protein